MKANRLLVLSAIFILILAGLANTGVFGRIVPDRIGSYSLTIPDFLKPKAQPSPGIQENLKVVNEESVITNVVEKATPSVVTIGIRKTQSAGDLFQINPFDPFAPFRSRQGKPQTLEQDIGSGFIVSSDGLIVTNKHVVSDTEATYRVILENDATYDVTKIYRDPTNDLAIIKINASGLKPVEMGDSDKIKVGQMAIAIGTALGQFRSTVTVGVISGVGRGITAGSPFEGYVEKLDNVIQTDAAINPGNSGGPLLNSGGQVIGINTAVSSEGQNIGFAIPINVIKTAINNFNSTGQFNRPYLGVRYKQVTKDLAVLNDLPEGAYVLEVIEGSPAEAAGVKQGDIIKSIDNTRLTGDSDLAVIIGKKKVGEKITLVLWRDGKDVTVTATLGNQNQ